MRHRRLHLIVAISAICANFAICAIAIGGTSPAAAQATDAQPAFVYGINAAVPGSFVGTFAPGDDAVYLLAGEPSVLSPRMTEIYFWPITNEYRANWATHNDPVSGTLEILRGDSLIAALDPVDYTIHFTRREDETTAELFLGDAAADAEARFRAKQDAFREATTAYNDAEKAWLAAAAEANSRIKAGESATIPPPPEPPAPIGVFSNGLNSGMAVALEPGTYRLRLRGDDGAIVPGSERELVVFAARRTGVGYTVVPETRWTTPLESPAPGEVIFGEAGANLYLEPHLAREYPSREWSLLQNPQRPAASAGGWEWVNGELLRDGVLELVAGDRVIAEESLTPFQVKQAPGRQLGYEVIEYDPTAENAPAAPDFEAFPLTLTNSGEQFQIRLRSAQGEVMAGSMRPVRNARSVALNRLFLLPLVPLAVGAAVVSRRRRVVIPREIAG